MLFKNNEYRDLIKYIKKSSTILLFAHINPDGDALGSLIALKRAIQQFSKASIFPILLDEVHHDLDFLPDLDETILLQNVDNNCIDFSKTIAISVDVADIGRMGDAKEIFLKSNIKAQFDHHETNNAFADINFIDPKASSTAELIYKFIKDNNLLIDNKTAIALYTGISTDTGNFSFSNTNAKVFEIMTELMSIGLPISEIHYILFDRKQVAQQKILGRALNNLHIFADGKAAYFFLNKNDFTECEAYSEHITNFANQLMDIEGICVAFFIYEKRNGTIRVSLRSKNLYRVDEIAATFGGGGHKYASGCNMVYPLDKSIRLLQNAVEKLFVK